MLMRLSFFSSDIGFSFFPSAGLVFINKELPLTPKLGTAPAGTGTVEAVNKSPVPVPVLFVLCETHHGP
jgi:hypothetical protein